MIVIPGLTSDSAFAKKDSGNKRWPHVTEQKKHVIKKKVCHITTTEPPTKQHLTSKQKQKKQRNTAPTTKTNTNGDGTVNHSGRKQPLATTTTTTKVVVKAVDEDLYKTRSTGRHSLRSVRWRVQSPSSVVAWQCNCTDCSMRGNTHFVVPSERFELLGDSKRFLTTYTFGTHTAKHIFCMVCGITSFYIPRSNPDGVAVTFRCVDPGTLTHVEIKHFDGRNWEKSYHETGIASCSKGQ